MLYRLFVVLVLLTGCGMEEKNKCKGTDNTETCETGSHVQSAPQAAPTPAPAAKPDAGYLTGYIAAAFDIEVDGKRYADSEDFYTQQLDYLAAEARAAGYGDYSMKFDAEIGLDDLKYGMKVYVAAKTFAAETRVDNGGRFMLDIPAPHGTESFEIRTNKRVSVLLTAPNNGETVKWCYNMSGHVQDAGLEKYAIVSQFSIRLTKYACDVAGGSGMTIPTNPAQTKAEPVPATTQAPTQEEKDKAAKEQAAKEFADYVQAVLPAETEEQP